MNDLNQKLKERGRMLLVDSMMTPKGGWTRKSLESIGVQWPPTKGWRKHFIKTGESLFKP